MPVDDPTWRPEESLSLWRREPLAHRPDPGADPGVRLAFDDAARPDRWAIYDGRRHHGWSGHEAGLLRPPAAALLLAHLLACVDDRRGAGRPRTVTPPGATVPAARSAPSIGPARAASAGPR